MERQVANVKKAITILLAVTFVVCVICYGSNKRFSFERWIENIAAGVSEIPSIQGIIDIWDQGKTASDMQRAGPGGGDNSGGEYVGGDEERTNFFEKTMDFFQSIGNFFSRLWDTILYLVDMLMAIFRLVGVILPWNATVEV